MGRTTAGVHIYHIQNKEDKKNDTESSNSTSWRSIAKGKMTRTARSVLDEIKDSNKSLREAHRIEEQAFYIELEHDLCEMRNDTSLSVIDIPGVNEADTNSIYKKYAEDSWQTFDCVVVVMDARAGVNTAEQVDLLNFVKTNMKEKKDIPVIILCNKVDDPDDEELAVLVKEVKHKVESVFGVGCRDQALQTMLSANSTNSVLTNNSPVFIATSAIHAFFYRSASLLSFEQFKTFDKELIEKFGREEVGRFRWKKMTDEEKYDEIFKAVSDQTRYKERLAATNFDKFLLAFSCLIGGDETQKHLLSKQIDVDIKSLLTSHETIDNIIHKIPHTYDKCLLLNKGPAPLKHAFWQLYTNSFEQAKDSLKLTPSPGVFSESMKLLTALQNLASTFGWKEELSRVSKEAKSIFRSQLEIVTEKYYRWDFSFWERTLSKKIVCSKCTDSGDKVSTNRKRQYKKNKANKAPTCESNDDILWGALSPYDWLLILDSLLLMSHDKHFIERALRQKRCS